MRATGLETGAAEPFLQPGLRPRLQERCDEIIDLPAQPRELAAAFCRLGGLLIAACVPTVFWVFALSVGSSAIGISIAGSTLVAFGSAVAAQCFLSAAVVIGGHQEVRAS